MVIAGDFEGKSDVSNFKWLAVAGTSALVLAGCSGPGNAPKQDQGLVAGAIAGGVLGSQIGRGKGSVVGTVLGAVVGGVVGSEIGRSLDERDRRLAQQAEIDAFERGQSNRPVRWQNPDNGRYGEVVPGPAYQRGAQPCREYTHTVYIGGRPQAMRGTACRNPDGTWSNVG
jgi:surface antigen